MQHSAATSIMRAVREALGLLTFADARRASAGSASRTTKPKKTTKTV
jgi:hypothetical protein